MRIIAGIIRRALSLIAFIIFIFLIPLEKICLLLLWIMTGFDTFGRCQPLAFAFLDWGTTGKWSWKMY